MVVTAFRRRRIVDSQIHKKPPGETRAVLNIRIGVLGG
jgi:hypothetical protein